MNFNNRFLATFAIGFALVSSSIYDLLRFPPQQGPAAFLPLSWMILGLCFIFWADRVYRGRRCFGNEEGWGLNELRGGDAYVLWGPGHIEVSFVRVPGRKTVFRGINGERLELRTNLATVRIPWLGKHVAVRLDPKPTSTTTATRSSRHKVSGDPTT